MAERDLKDDPIPTPPPWVGIPPLHQVAQTGYSCSDHWPSAEHCLYEEVHFLRTISSLLTFRSEIWIHSPQRKRGHGWLDAINSLIPEGFFWPRYCFTARTDKLQIDVQENFLCCYLKQIWDADNQNHHLMMLDISQLLSSEEKEEVET